ncbi:CDP-diacylglycerol--glycerol-3-phosphate 3-phosphatidyltransferase [Rathayibacter toxicus]|uniref:CDP-diacylglycerol--glycerol-3-phosphate 3-phosphatidyltransferase n=1 Tax=Rathayibacter toxicus TaxID=145458 RepID=A0A2S5Y7W9_9MICO|nr:CDP-diacylglycerol--glycerol-3-phosphate 3-phosphatidyltransferase [Rathayibacter toxicus]PPH24327.1 CDP-diacylglycerol--glycerol-3-phosphate 3-phosphatidyltransferase [Rathayibacter toxicus]PPH57879.1 CDP-diacylglycerol--glycerol-3-phosphate 3-phosphatidyltransferase [Rathayibacter toxicus]PPH60357.1 CDP-diacylglycerol--glycerol-3-phosphate 3-phosphatidyltransferase [Rathayibacter toxicus]PPH87897.1 CDP-diacylglycerol--glycerol-3-phosphate 3-phosphatidyltransferase [Rathayibacter toxicus]P
MTSSEQGSSRSKNWNLPNAITVVRILLAPIFFWLLVVDGGQDGPLRVAAALLFIVAIATDGIDGHLARSRGLVTDLGTLLDPIADKVLTGAALVGLAILGELPWWVTIVVLVREIGITVFRMAVLSDRVIPASRGGKLKTIAQSIAISLALLPLWTLVGGWVQWLNSVTMTVAVGLTVITGIDYLADAARQSRANRVRS